MKQKISRLSLVLFAALFLSSIPACKTKVKDTDVKTSVETAFRANPDYSTVMVDVKDGVATLTGQAKDEATRMAAETSAKAIKGVKSVTNNITVTVAPPVNIAPDDPLQAAVNDAIKDHPGVMASVNDGVITLTGEINRSDLSTLMQKLSSLNPRKIDNKLVTK